MIDDAIARVPPIHAPWIRYENELEYHKWTMENRCIMPCAWIMLFHQLEGKSFVENLEYYTGECQLTVDPTKRGAGLHMMLPGGHLQTHLDYAVHPSGLERRVNLILALQDTNPEHGGATQLCDADGNVQKKVYLKRNEALVWQCSDESYHGVEPLSKNSPVRYTAASYYLGPLKSGVSRRRALFIPRR